MYSPDGDRSSGERHSTAPTAPTAPTARTFGAPKASSSSSLREERFTLRLYIAGQTPRSVTALANLRKLCEEFLPGRYDLEIIDLIQNPKRARTDQILAIPTLVRSLPIPIARIIGDLSDTDQVLLGLNIQRHTAAWDPEARKPGSPEARKPGSVKP